MLEYYWLGVFSLFGLIFGSFANVLIVRLPEKKSIVPSSHCVKCKAPVRWHDNFPVFSWIFLRGKCRSCDQKISIQYPIVELTMGLLFALSYYKYGFSYFLIEMLLFIFAAVSAAFIDFKHYILPDVFTLSGIVIGIVGALLNPERTFFSAFLGFLIGGGGLYLTAYLYYVIKKKEGMGGGDIKLLAWIGCVLGVSSLPFVLVCACLAGTVFALSQSVLLKKNISQGIPFGPFLVAAALIYSLGNGPTMVQWYLNFIGVV